MAAIQFPTSSAPGRFAEGGGRLINAYAEKLPDGRVRIGRVPGLRELLTVSGGYTGFRGGIFVNSILLAAFENVLLKIEAVGDGTYTSTLLGTMNGSGRVYFARNNKLPTPDIVAVADATAYECTTTSAPSPYSDPDVGSPNAVTFNKGYFIFTYGDGQMRASGLNDVAINTLDFAFAESKPDGLLFPAPIGSNLLAMGQQTIEIWRVDPNNANGFPFSFLDTIPIGLISQNAIAGHEDGWTNKIVMVGHDGVPYRLDGYSPTPLRHLPVIRAIEALEDKSELEASVYVHEGHAIWALSSNSWTWCYDLTADAWHERVSYERERWRVSASVKAFGIWLGGDDTGKISAIDPLHKKECGDPLIWEVVSATATGFPNRMALPGIEIDMLAGVGIANGESDIETDPSVRIDWSIDGGVTWASPLLRKLGKQGEYANDIRVNSLGTVSNRGVQIRLHVSDPVDATLFGGEFRDPQKRAS